MCTDKGGRAEIVVIVYCLLNTSQESFSVVDIEPLAYFVVAQQPDIVNTVPLTNEELSHSVSLLIISNLVFEDKNAAVYGATDKSTFTCSPGPYPAVAGK